MRHLSGRAASLQLRRGDGACLCAVGHANRPSSLGRADFGPNRAGGARVPSKIRAQRARAPCAESGARASSQSLSAPPSFFALHILAEPWFSSSPVARSPGGSTPSRQWPARIRRPPERMERAEITPAKRRGRRHRAAARMGQWGARSRCSSSRPGRRPSVFWSLSGPCLRPVSVVPGPSRSGLSGHPPDFCAREGSICATCAS